MKKVNNLEPNYCWMLRSYIASLQHAYNNYKACMKDELDSVWIGDDGSLVMWDGYDERHKKTEEAAREVAMLMRQVAEVRSKVDEQSTANFKYQEMN